MTLIRFTPIPDTDRVRLDFPFDRTINEIVKGMPGPFRGFDAQRRHWWVHERFAEELADHLGAAGHDVAGGHVPTAEVETIETFFGESAEYDATAKARDILADIPVQHQGKVFREMAKLLHPDLYRR